MRTSSALTLAALLGLGSQFSAIAAENIVKNPGFEQNTDGWVSNGFNQLDASDEQAHTGQRSCLASHRIASFEGPSQSLNRKLFDEHRYTLSAWVRLRKPSATPIVAQMTVTQTDGSGTTYTPLAKKKVSADRWTELRGVLNFKSTGILSMLKEYFEVLDSTEDFFLDDVSIVDEGLADGLHVEIAAIKGNSVRLRVVQVPAPKASEGNLATLEILRLDGSSAFAGSCAPGGTIAATLQDGLYKVRAIQSLAEGKTSEAFLLLPIGEMSAVFKGVAADARQAMADPTLKTYAGWLQYQTSQIEAARVALGVADKAGMTNALDVKEALSTGADLADWVRRIREKPTMLAERHGTFEWAYLSKVDGTGQPFVVTVPEGYDASHLWPLVVMLHGGGLFHTFGWGYPPATNYLDLRPLGRATQSGYWGISEIDVLEAIDYVRANWRVDESRTHLFGPSMGGTGTFALGTRFPDRFASARPMCGWTDAPLANAVNLPFRTIHGTVDWAVPIIYGRAATLGIRKTGGMAILDEVDGQGHLIDAPELIQEGLKWALRQTRPAAVAHVHYEALDQLASGAYWVRIAEWGPRAEPAVVDAHLGPDNSLNLGLNNVTTAEFDLTAARADLTTAMIVAVDGRVVTTLAPPLPRRLFVSIGEKGWQASGSPPELPDFRLHAPGGAMALYHGEPLMVVWGTKGDAETNRRIYDVAQIARRSPNPQWPDPGTLQTGKSVDLFLTGSLAGKPDTDVTAEDIQRFNLLLIGTEKQNALAARWAAQMPVRTSAGRLVCSDDQAWPLNGRGFGVLCFNPDARQRLIYWVGSDTPAFYRPGNPLMAAQNVVAPPDLTIVSIQDVQLVAARSFDSRWRWEAGYKQSPLLSPQHCRRGAFGQLLAEVYRQAAGADVGLVDNERAPQKLSAAAAGETRLADLVATEFNTPLSLVNISGKRLAELAQVCARMEQEAMAGWKQKVEEAKAQGVPEPIQPETPKLTPPLAAVAVDPDRTYRVAAYPWAFDDIAGQAHFVPEHFEMLDLTAREALERKLPTVAGTH